MLPCCRFEFEDSIICPIRGSWSRNEAQAAHKWERCQVCKGSVRVCSAGRHLSTIILCPLFVDRLNIGTKVKCLTSGESRKSCRAGPRSGEAGNLSAALWRLNSRRVLPRWVFPVRQERTQPESPSPSSGIPAVPRFSDTRRRRRDSRRRRGRCRAAYGHSHP